jgi:hypothetical protein
LDGILKSVFLNKLALVLVILAGCPIFIIFKPKPMRFLLLLSLLLSGLNGFGQHNAQTTLFKDEAPLDIKMRFNVKQVKSITNDTIYTATSIQYKIGNHWDSIRADIRVRGNFRRANCYFPPLRIKIKKEHAKGTVFEGNRSLKLVMPCKSAKDGSLILREYLCYQMYEPVTKYTFNTRLVNIDFTDDSNKKMNHISIPGFFIEDDDQVAKRHHGEVVERKLHPLAMEDSTSLRHDFFQFMIANTDWSTAFMHNAKLIQLTESKKFIPLTYDFDMSGFVDAPYAEANETLGIASVRERLYRGFCRNPEIVQAIRKEYQDKQQAIMAPLNAYQASFDPKEYAGMVKYMDEFFAILSNDSKFKLLVTDKCRTK